MAGIAVASGPGSIRQLAPRNHFVVPSPEFREFGVRPLHSSSSGGNAPRDAVVKPLASASDARREPEPSIKSIEPQAEPPADVTKRFPYGNGDSR